MSAMEGREISDRYRIERRLGSGGMSTVYLAFDSILEREVAVKVLAEHLSDDEKFVARFRREALAVAKLIHPNIVQVYDTGVDGGQHYIVMEYVEGQSAAQILRREGRVAPDSVIEIGAQACRGLEHAHKRGIIHRDIKPGNLMIVNHETGERGMVVKLTDFGIARTSEQSHITQAGSVVGTAAYLSPEQSQGQEAEPQSDVYSLGVVLYQLLTGLLPYEGSSLAELAIRQQNENPLPPDEHVPEIPQELGWVVLRALELDPADRYSSAGDLGNALVRASEGEGEPPAMATEPTRRIDPDGESDTAELERTGLLAAGGHEQVQQTRGREPAQTGERSAAGRAFRGLGAFLALLLIAAVAAVTIIATSSSSSGADVREVIRDTVQEQVQGLKDLVDDNTR